MARSARLLELLEIAAKVHSPAAAEARAKTEGALAMAEVPSSQASPLQAAHAPVGVVCACCAESFTSLKRHLWVDHGMDELTYRGRYNIPLEVPLVSASYLARKQACVDAYRGGTRLSQ